MARSRTMDKEKLERIIVVEVGNLPIIIFKGKLGYIATAQICKESADRMGDVAAIVPAVNSVEAFLKSKLREVSEWAEDLGLRKGMTVKRAMRVLDGEEKL